MMLDRWKLSTFALAGVSLFLGLRTWGGGDDAANQNEAPPSTSRAAGLRQLRIPGHLIGIDERALLRQLRHARNVAHIRLLCERLGFVGTDRAVDALAELAKDPRPGVADAALSAIGHIGTARATTLLLEIAGSPASRYRAAAIAALGRTGQDRARGKLIAIARARGDHHRTDAIAALGQLGGAGVI